MLNLKKTVAMAVLTSLSVGTAFARDTTHNLPFDEAVAKAVEAGTIDGSVKFYLAGKTPAGVKIIDSNVITNKKTNAFGKSDDAACDWVLRSALIALQDAAKAKGANAVVDVVSYYKSNETKSSTSYECHAGAVMAGVALKAKLAKI